MKHYIPYNASEFVTIYNRTSSGHFFDKDTMSFFKSRVCESAFHRDEKNNCIYFMTSEKAGFHSSERVFSIRKATAALVNGREKWVITTLDSCSRTTRRNCINFLKDDLK